MTAEEVAPAPLLITETVAETVWLFDKFENTDRMTSEWSLGIPFASFTISFLQSCENTTQFWMMAIVMWITSISICNRFRR